jgi:hypothetical protein
VVVCVVGFLPKVAVEAQKTTTLVGGVDCGAKSGAACTFPNGTLKLLVADTQPPTVYVVDLSWLKSLPHIDQDDQLQIEYMEVDGVKQVVRLVNTSDRKGTRNDDADFTRRESDDDSNTSSQTDRCTTVDVDTDFIITGTVTATGTLTETEFDVVFTTITVPGTTTSTSTSSTTTSRGETCEIIEVVTTSEEAVTEYSVTVTETFIITVTETTTIVP